MLKWTVKIDDHDLTFPWSDDFFRSYPDLLRYVRLLSTLLILSGFDLMAHIYSRDQSNGCCSFFSATSAFSSWRRDFTISWTLCLWISFCRAASTCCKVSCAPFWWTALQNLWRVLPPVLWYHYKTRNFARNRVDSSGTRMYKAQMY